MRFRNLAAATLALAVVSAPRAGADEFAGTGLWKHVAGWEIRVDTTLAYGCFMFASFDDGDVLRVGFNRSRRHAYVLVTSSQWDFVESENRYELTFRFDDLPAWDVKARGVSFDAGPPYLYLRFSDSEFFNELTLARQLTVQYDGEEVARLPLAGSYVAGAELLECQRAAEETR